LNRHWSSQYFGFDGRTPVQHAAVERYQQQQAEREKGHDDAQPQAARDRAHDDCGAACDWRLDGPEWRRYQRLGNLLRPVRVQRMTLRLPNRRILLQPDGM
jgi:hypothetical protein